MSDTIVRELGGMYSTGFQMVAYYDKETDVFELANCSCGWCFNGFPEELTAAMREHEPLHLEFIKVRRRFAEQSLSYDAAFHFLVMLGMAEAKAEDYLDTAIEGPR